ncbi:MAG: RraA family protein [Verrucomicrobiota bacterium]
MNEDPIAILDKLYSAVVADVLDGMGYRHRCLSADVQALTPNQKVCGRVFTAKAQPVNEIPDEPYKLEMEAIDTMQAGDVLVVDADGNRESAFWGELLSTACLAKGVRGAVMNTCCRDLWALSQMEFPVFGTGKTPADSKGRIDVVSIKETIVMNEVVINTGDYVLGDMDGVVIIPEDAAEEALKLAYEKVTGENTVREELRAGVPVAEVFRKHGIL